MSNRSVIPRGVMPRGGPAVPSHSVKPSAPMGVLPPFDSGFGDDMATSGRLILPGDNSFRGGDVWTETDRAMTHQHTTSTVSTRTTYNDMSLARDSRVDSGVESMCGLESRVQSMALSEPRNVQGHSRVRIPTAGKARTTRIAEMSKNNSSNTVVAPSHRSNSPMLVSSTTYVSNNPPQPQYEQFYNAPVPAMHPRSSYNMQSHSPHIDIRNMLQQNVQFFVQDKEGDTGLHLAIIHSQGDLLDRLLYLISKEPVLQGVIDEQNAMYQTALHLAVHTQQIDMIRKLLLSGASLNVPDHKGNTALHIAAQFSSTKSLEELALYVPLQTLLDVARIRNNDGQTCVHIAAQHGNTDLLRKLKSYGVDIDMQDLKSGKTALHVSVENSSLRNVQFLLETCHANVNATTFTGCTSLHIASGRGDISTVAYLISQGANPDLQTDEGDTALEIAGSEEVISLLTKAAALKWMY